VSIEQLSDFEPKGKTCRAFGVYHPGGFPQRALVIIGPDTIVKWSYEADSPGDLPGANLIFDGLATV
jgi:peroxiredoxin (alkyl hydroperoxide reductase subunit C)